MEEESFSHIFHEHPLSLISDFSKYSRYVCFCYGCGRRFMSGDLLYGCNLKCGFEWFLHKECMEMPREIMHPIHPSHPLTLFDRRHISNFKECEVCKESVRRLGYICSQGGCDGFWIHLGCTAGLFNYKQPLVHHPSHPHHQLRFSKKTRWCPFPCDACGAIEKGDSYTCTVCDYCIHESCALLPLSADFPRLHPAHPLSLAFFLPSEYIEYGFDCAICSSTLPLRHWVYHCRLCKYVVHLNCATSKFDDENENASDDEKEVTRFPIAVEDMYEDIIKPFVKRERGQSIIPHYDHDNQYIGGKYRFFNHPDHLLTFTTFSSASTSSSSSHAHYKKDYDDDVDEDDFDSILRWELTCDGCTLPIYEKKQTDGDGYESGYMSCDECKYFLHLSCFNLPLHIPSLPIHPLKNHSLRLQNADMLTSWRQCDICVVYTNGLYYACTYKHCWFTIDIKCASLPNTIKHAAHPRHNYLDRVSANVLFGFCDSCHLYVSSHKGKYKCNSCRFLVCGSCVILPATNKHRLENHLLSLTYDAYVNRPGDFYCSSCEGQINPRKWMYHCRDCDQSFHPKCFPAMSDHAV
ncbi:uncharacterized protein LOC125224461 [Salvia hispanica]|uniref:uncharacterized protein LOC125224461 n=1 Tax=Salvia hispanica TaxID=49212 RepID=UPI002008EFB2|nr:uncharacterized protein LOC125224461 [Salvia hispanica]